MTRAHRSPRRRRPTRALVATLVVAVTSTAAVVVLAAWLAGGAGTSSLLAQSVAAGNAPTVNALGSSVTVSWSASTLSGGAAVSGYVIRRYDGGGVAQTVGASCAGTVAALTCTETNVPNGSWQYSVTPVRANWTGAESTKTGVTVAAPTVTSTNPSSRGQGATGQNIVITGTNFVSGANATFSGTGITVNSTTFNSATQVTANITIAGGATTGASNVTVTNPDAGAGSCTGCFTVNAAPTVTSTNPSSRGQGATNQNIVVTGTNFVSGASAGFSGAGITVNSTTFNSSTQVTANITIAAGATTGARNVTVTNPDAGAGSCASCFTVNTGVTVTSTNPSSRGQGAINQNIVITGTNFLTSPTVAFSGTGITINTTTRNSATQITVNIAISGSAATGARDVTVTNTDGGSGTCASCFTVNAGPNPTSVSPNKVILGILPGSQGVTITGTNFVSGATVSLSGPASLSAGSATVSGGGTQITVTISWPLLSLGFYDVIVTNPDGGRGTCVSCFQIALVL